MPNFGIEPLEELSKAAQQVIPGAGLAATEQAQADEISFSRRELAAFYGLVQALNTLRGRDELVSAFTEKLSSIVSYETCALTLIAPDTGAIVVAHARGEHAEVIRGRSIGLGEGITGWVIANQKPFCNTDPRLDFPPSLAENFQAYKTLASFPLLKDGQMYGALTVYSSTRSEYGREQQKLLQESAAVLTNALSSVTQSSRNTEVEIAKEQPNEIRLSQDSTLPSGANRLESDLTH